jgi:L-seryl-tRNA(Ser) seleniumtransferase
MSEAKARLRALPSVDRLVTDASAEPWFISLTREYVTRHCRAVLDQLRARIARGDDLPAEQLEDSAILSAVASRIVAERETRLLAVVNATGTVLHTNLGRALLPQAAIDAVSRVAGRPVTLEYDLANGGRGRREELIQTLLLDLTGAAAATVVNNNAAAVLVAVNSLASGREVIVSRGELVEIGGAFRIPDILARSGAILREVGTTNRTHPADYERAIGPDTALLLKVHTSNYRVVGFSSEVSLRELVTIGRAYHLPVMEDLGSGALVDLEQFGLPKEPVVAEQVALGADIVTFSGDKLLGGPQAGLVVGTRACLTLITDNPLHRAVRCGKLTIAALEATLKVYLGSANVVAAIPTLRMLARPLDEMAALGAGVVPALERILGDSFAVSLEDSTSQVGSGALPTDELPTKVIAITSSLMSAARVAERFRTARPPIIGRINDGRFLLDLRTIFDGDDLIPRWIATAPSALHVDC